MNVIALLRKRILESFPNITQEELTERLEIAKKLLQRIEDKLGHPARNY